MMLTNAHGAALATVMMLSGCQCSRQTEAPTIPTLPQTTEPSVGSLHPPTPPHAGVGKATMRSPAKRRDFDLLDNLTEAIERRVVERGYKALSSAEQTIHVIFRLEAEVNNGGFHQYYFNSAGDHALAAPAALLRIGARRAAALVREANEAFPEPGPSPQRETRIQQLEQLPAEGRFEQLDDRFYQYPEDLQRLLAAFARAHRADLPSVPGL